MSNWKIQKVVHFSRIILNGYVFVLISLRKVYVFQNIDEKAYQSCLLLGVFPFPHQNLDNLICQEHQLQSTVRRKVKKLQIIEAYLHLAYFDQLQNVTNVKLLFFVQQDCLFFIKVRNVESWISQIIRSRIHSPEVNGNFARIVRSGRKRRNLAQRPI